MHINLFETNIENVQWMFGKMWIPSDHTIFKTFLNLHGERMIEIRLLFRQNFHFSWRFRVFQFGTKKI